MATLTVVCFLACLALAAGQKPAPISADEAGPGPAPGSAPMEPLPPSPPSMGSASAMASAPMPPVVAMAMGMPARPGCNLGAYHAVGDSWFTSGREGCLKYTCQRSGVVSSQPCPRVLAPEGCTVTNGDADALFPACCPQRECSPGVPVPLPAVVSLPDVPDAASKPAVSDSSSSPSTPSAETSTSTSTSTSTETSSTTTAASSSTAPSTTT